MASRTKDISGQRFGRLVTIRPVGATKSGQSIWLCKCDCGNECLKRADVLKSGHSNSCGCYRKEKGKKTIRNAVNKRLEVAEYFDRERLHKVWKSMIGRCVYTSHISYGNYGGRGITVCEEWLNSYKAFKEWAVKTGYDEHAKRGICTLDRIDNNGNYEPSNCRWVSMKEQAKNRRPRSEWGKDKRQTLRRMLR